MSDKPDEPKPEEPKSVAASGRLEGSGDFVASIADVVAALDRIEVGQTTLGTKLSAVEAGQKSLRAEVLGELSQTSLEVARLEAALTTLRVDLMERMDRLQNRLDGLDDHLTMGLGNSDRVERKSDSVAEQNRLLAEQMSTMHKLLRRLEGRINDIEDRK